MLEAKKELSFVIIGHVCLDRNILEDGSTFVGPGSPAMFIDKILKQFPDTSLSTISSYGSDYIQYLQGINIFPSTPNMADTLVYQNDSSRGRRRQSVLNTHSSSLVGIDGAIGKLVSQADVIFVAPLLPNFSVSYCKDVNNAAREGALKVLVPQGYFRTIDASSNVISREFEEAGDIIPLFDVIITSEEDHPNMKALSRH